MNHKEFRKRQNLIIVEDSSPNNAFGSRQGLGKAVSRAKKSLPNSPGKRKAIVRKLFHTFSPGLVVQIPKNSVPAIFSHSRQK